MNDQNQLPSPTEASQAVIAARSAQPGGPKDLDALIAAAEQAVIRRDAVVRQRTTELATRLHLGGGPRKAAGRAAGVGFGVAAGGLALAKLVLGRATKSAGSDRRSGGGLKLPWARVAAVAWPLVPARVRGRVSPGTAAAVAGFVVPVLARAVRGKAPPETAARVDLQRYAGRWYEVARFPARFEGKCVGDVSATYAFDGQKGRILNRCRLRDGRMQSVVGAARVVPGSHDARLKVSFANGWLRWLPGGWSDYWILGVDPDYQAALVGTPDRDRLWLLSRRPRIDDSRYTWLVDRAKAQGYDTSRLKVTSQSRG